MNDIREVHSAEFHYPGSLFPESITRSVPEATLEAAVAAQRDELWYAVVLRTRVQKRFTAADGEEVWNTVGQSTKVASYVVGEPVHVDDIPDDDQHHILRSNIRSNSKGEPLGVRTRRGNWQIASDYDAVVDSTTMQVSV